MSYGAQSDRTVNHNNWKAATLAGPKVIRNDDVAGFYTNLADGPAKALLESTQLSLEEITSRCGYGDVSTFSKIFKRRVQVTPREYRGRFGLRV